MRFTLAHLSDPHLCLPQGGPPLLSLNGKQLLALASWRRRRRHVTSPAVLEALGRDLLAHAPDHIAVTGDLVNLAWPPEYRQARLFLAGLGPPEGVTVVPGNHDLTRRLAWMDGIGQWHPWMRGDGGGEAEAALFPFLRRRGEVALIGVSSAVPTRLFSAAGRLGRAQLERVAATLAAAARERLFRVVLIHHPPVIGPGGERRALQDRSSLCAVLKRHGAELVLHGHHHVSRLAVLPGPAGPIPVLGAASASCGSGKQELAGWRLLTIERESTGWRLTSAARRYDPAAGCFREFGQWSLRVHPRRLSGQ